MADPVRRLITKIYVLPDGDYVNVIRNIKTRHGLDDSTNLGWMKARDWEKFITKEYERINMKNSTLCERFKLKNIGLGVLEDK